MDYTDFLEDDTLSEETIRKLLDYSRARGDSVVAGMCSAALEGDTDAEIALAEYVALG